jgi:hypothetical protein
MGLVAGGFLCYNINEIFALQPELLFSMKGWKVMVEEGEGVAEMTAKLNYIEIPLLLKVNLPTDGKIDPSLYAGPGFGILLSAKASTGGGGGEYGFNEDIKMDGIASLDIGMIAGAGLAYQMESGALSFEARYEVGLTSLAKDEDADTGKKASMLNSVISIMVGYGFAF